MNQYRAKVSFIARTVGGQRVQIEAGKMYHGGYDFRDISAGRSVLFVKVDGRNDEVHMVAGTDFIDKFLYLGHVDKIEYMTVQIVKRPRISK
jgi:hypothetical protein